MPERAIDNKKDLVATERSGKLREIPGIARKGWLEPGVILTTLGTEGLRAFLKGRNP